MWKNKEDSSEKNAGAEENLPALGIMGGILLAVLFW